MDATASSSRLFSCYISEDDEVFAMNILLLCLVCIKLTMQIDDNDEKVDWQNIVSFSVSGTMS